MFTATGPNVVSTSGVGAELPKGYSRNEYVRNACAHSVGKVFIPKTIPARFSFASSLKSCSRSRSQLPLGWNYRQCQQIRCSSGTCHPGEEREGAQHFPSNISVPATGMAKFGGQLGGATLEKSKLDLSRETKTWEPRTDDSGGGGDNGKNIFNGGGGDGDDGDDDDYFDDFGEGDGDGGDDGFFRAVVMQLYDEASRRAVLQEWYRTMADLPFMLRQAAEFGLLSSAQLVRFFSMDVRPNVTRFVIRNLPTSASRGIVGRLMADPAFMQKMVVEQLITVGSSLYWEYSQRRERFTKELDLVAINTLCLSGANMALVWLISPSRSYGVPHKHDWQRMLHELPSNVFDASGPQRQYTLSKRLTGLVAKTAELCAVGTMTGAAMSSLSLAAVQLRKSRDPGFEPSVPIPSVASSSAGCGVAVGMAANLRYQLIAGADRWLFDHGKYLWPYLVASGALRLVSNRLGEGTRLYLQGLPVDAPVATKMQPQTTTAASQPIVAAPSGKRRTKAKKAKRSKGFEMSMGVPSTPAMSVE